MCLSRCARLHRAFAWLDVPIDSRGGGVAVSLFNGPHIDREGRGLLGAAFPLIIARVIGQANVKNISVTNTITLATQNINQIVSIKLTAGTRRLPS